MRVWTLVMATLVVALLSVGVAARAQPGGLTTAKSLRCTFPLHAVGTWDARDAPTASVTPSTVIQRFEAINIEDGTASLRSGSVGSEITVRAAGGYLHFMQSFKTGPLYTTTVFDQKTARGTFKAVHSRHEYFSTPLPGATSSPEQYYGECAVVP